MKILSPIILAALVSISSLAHSAEYNEAEGIISNAHFEVRLGELGDLSAKKGEFVDGIAYAIDYWSGLFGNNYLDREKVSIDFGARSTGFANCASNQIYLNDTSLTGLPSIEERTINGKQVGVYSSAELLLQYGVDVDADTAYQADMTITINEMHTDYYGTRYDIPSMIIHEIAHGLGVNRGAVRYASALGQLYVSLENLTTWEAMYNVDVYNSSTLAFGTTITLGDPSLGLSVYNPSDYNSGSSFIHIDEDSDPNAVMQYLIEQGDVRREFTVKELALFQAMGWNFAPEPSSSFLILLSLPALLGRRRRARA